MKKSTLIYYIKAILVITQLLLFQLSIFRGYSWVSTIIFCCILLMFLNEMGLSKRLFDLIDEFSHDIKLIMRREQIKNGK